MEGDREKVYISTYLLIMQTKLVFDVSKFNSVFKLISQISCQDLPTKKTKQTGHCHPDYKGKRCEIRE